ncbi:DUF1735 and LamG domain-containing protein [Bacteroides ovatus]|uniref:DUF1735 and LamG domain-containing protein n=1 Tax=Bacteroides ovatus TaxID=28116 RepID=UPI002165A1AD|nr:DUF1735 and LamG domain-containing protein [Bacteroides ovatus]MCS2930558.1 DUF1735 and LamG domain-containing protein [Bacteroides ovatus]
MKLIKQNILILGIASVIFGGCKSNDADEHHFDNMLYIDTESATEELYFKNNPDEGDPMEQTVRLNVSTALKAENEIHARFVINPNAVNSYNSLFGKNALPLPEEKCIISNPEVTIKTGFTSSEATEIKFSHLETLDESKIYVMPIELDNVTGVEVLTSKTRKYIIFKGASLINVVADMSHNYAVVNWKNTNEVKNLETITVEALIRSRDWGKVEGKPEAMSTLFGVEGHFLIRFGDAALPENQLQLVDPNGTFPSSNSKLGLPINEWVHVAVVWNARTGERIIYYNGEAVANDKKRTGKLTLLKYLQKILLLEIWDVKSGVLITMNVGWKVTLRNYAYGM